MTNRSSIVLSVAAPAQNRSIKILLASAGLAACLIFSAHGARAAESTKNFVMDTSVGNEFEIKSSQLALQKSQSDEVKKFAQQMIDDHTKAEEDLKTAVSSAPDSDVQMPTSKLDKSHAKMMHKLNDTNGADFDKLYVKDQVKAHDTTVSMFKSYAKNGDNDTLKAFATQTLPTLESHQQEIDQIKSSM